MQRYFSNIKDNNYLVLKSDDLYHINKVMRMKNNDQIEVVYENKCYLCTLENNKAKIMEEMIDNIDSLIDITLCIPLLKEDKMDIIFQKATELGVKKIIPVRMERSIIKINQDKINKKILRWQKICKEASEQSKRVDIPIVTNIMEIKELENLDGFKMICSTREKKINLYNCLKKNKKCDKINIIVGPEGGLTLTEEKELKKIGFVSVSLGSRIMRVETVPFFILSILNYECME